MVIGIVVITGVTLMIIVLIMTSSEEMTKDLTITGDGMITVSLIKTGINISIMVETVMINTCNKTAILIGLVPNNILLKTTHKGVVGQMETIIDKVDFNFPSYI